MDGFNCHLSLSDDVLGNHVQLKFQGKQFGKVLLDLLILLAEQTNCYKLSLDCNEKAMPFYKKLNMDFVEDHRFMCIKFFD